MRCILQSNYLRCITFLLIIFFGSNFSGRADAALAQPDLTGTPYEALAKTEAWILDFKKDVAQAISGTAAGIKNGKGPDRILNELETHLKFNKELINNSNGVQVHLLRQEQMMVAQIKDVGLTITDQEQDSPVKQQYLETCDIAQKNLESYRRCSANLDILSKKVDLAMVSAEQWQKFYDLTAGITGAETSKEKLAEMIAKAGAEWIDAPAGVEGVVIDEFFGGLDLLSVAPPIGFKVDGIPTDEIDRKLDWVAELGGDNQKKIRIVNASDVSSVKSSTQALNNIKSSQNVAPAKESAAVRTDVRWGFGVGLKQGVWGPLILLPLLRPVQSPAVRGAGNGLSGVRLVWFKHAPSWGHPTREGYGWGYLFGLVVGYLGPLWFFKSREWTSVAKIWGSWVKFTWCIWFLFVLIPVML